MKTPLLDQKFSDLTDILKGAAASLAGFAGRTGARILFLLFAGNFYGADNLGRLAAVIAVTEILVTLGIFGFKRSLLEMLQADKAKEDQQYSLIKTALLVSFVVGTALAVALAFLWDFIGLIYGNFYYALFALIIPFMALMEVMLTTTRFKRIVRYEVFARSLVEPWTIALTSVLFFFLGWVTFGLILAYVLSMFAAFLFALWAFSKEFRWKKVIGARLKFDLVGRIFVFSGPTALVDVIGIAFRRVDVLFLGFFTPDAVVGIYYGVQQIATVLQKTRHIFDPILQPVLAQTLDQRGNEGAGQQLRQVCRWIFSLLALLLAIMAFYGGSLLSLVGEGFAIGALALTIVLAAEALEGTFASAELPFVFKRPFLNLSLSATAFAAHLTGLWFLIPKFGIVGAALSFLIAVVILNSMRLVAIKKKFNITLLSPGYMKPAAAGALSYLTLYYGNQLITFKTGFLVPLGIALGFGVYGLIFWGLKPSAEDREFISYLKSRKKPKLAVDKDFDQV